LFGSDTAITGSLGRALPSVFFFLPRLDFCAWHPHQNGSGAAGRRVWTAPFLNDRKLWGGLGLGACPARSLRRQRLAIRGAPTPRASARDSRPGPHGLVPFASVSPPAPSPRAMAVGCAPRFQNPSPAPHAVDAGRAAQRHARGAGGGRGVFGAPASGSPCLPPSQYLFWHCQPRRVTDGGARGRGGPLVGGVPAAGGVRQDLGARAAPQDRCGWGGCAPGRALQPPPPHVRSYWRGRSRTVARKEVCAALAGSS